MFTAGGGRRCGLVEARELLLWPGRMPHDARDACGRSWFAAPKPTRREGRGVMPRRGWWLRRAVLVRGCGGFAIG